MIAWEDPSAVHKRLESMEELMKNFHSQMEGTTFEKKGMSEVLELYKTKVVELDAERHKLNRTIDSLQQDLEKAGDQTIAVQMVADKARRDHEIDMDDAERSHRHNLEDIRMSNEESLRSEAREKIDTLIREYKIKIDDLERELRRELDEERSRRLHEVADLTAQRDAQLQNVAADIGKKEREASTVRDELRQVEANLEREKSFRASVESKLSEASANTLELEAANRALQARITYLESSDQERSQAFADLHRRTQEAIDKATAANDKLRIEETLRRKLHNQVQELKGNIRVFARVRPALGSEEDEAATITFPDEAEESKEIVVKGPEVKNALGVSKSQPHPYSFDRVFGPASDNSEIFEEISQLVQSALDGYNVCIFCYGQTGSGKTFTMSAPDGMIPLAVRQIYETAKGLEEKGWTYRMEGTFVEIYNEELMDLLGKSEDIGKKKHEIRHDTENKKISITGVQKVELDSPDRVQDMLKKAAKNRTVAQTAANERSSRSHSVFILTLIGENSITGDKSEGTLNLVDLAGSERLAHSQAEGQRLLETKAINKSLACLGDVIASLGKEGGHVPYRNSKLTHLLQYSLGGNSKTLMFVMISPLQAHLAETITSLKFAHKVHNTHIGTAKRHNKVAH
ncbi:carboxy-terminal kinesin 2 [Tothia fuscella]|uniref:Kinesin-like protein n=1 Tax=Tothia fuscella TaxID=1048955 RepID=A0A9P4NLN0_9PEZI|nr:carboxy-terminal kinesin 2 [Tothia fuscella]